MKILIILLINIGIAHAQLINKGSIVKDTSTGLIWQNIDNKSIRKNLIGAAKYCKSLKLGGYRDWRLPSMRELKTIMVYRRSGPQIAKPFVRTTNPYMYWSRTPDKYKRDYYFSYNFNDGKPVYEIMQAHHNIRCVRGRR